MNHLVFLDARASELEKILSGLKTMIVRQYDPISYNEQPVHPGDCLYFLRDEDDLFLRVKATVVQVLLPENTSNSDMTHILKEAQPKLQLTENQYNRLAGNSRVLLIEFATATKISLVRVSANKISDHSDWIAFKDFSLIT